MLALTAFVTELERQRGHLFPWVPVMLGIGVGLFFSLPIEPPIWIALILLCVLPFALWRATRLPTTWAYAVMMASLIAAGLSIAILRTDFVREPVLDFRYYGPIQGRIVGLSKSLSDKPRMLLDSVVLADVRPSRTPARVRVSIHTGDPRDLRAVGTLVMLTGHLSPPSGPAEPGGFDFQRHAWFLELGGVGYTRSPTMVLDSASGFGWRVSISRMRHGLSAIVRDAVPGDAGGFAAAVLTGDRSGISRKAMEDLRAANLAHLLAISGLHMGLLTGFVFALLRLALACIPVISVRFPVKKIAAVFALAAGAFYLILSGGSVATERAYVMAAVVFSAVLMDRRALTIRAVAVAATIILVLRPESLISPGFQMSFAATIALVAVFRAVSDWEHRRVPRWLRPLLGVILSSAVAGAATAPLSAAHFNQVAHYGLLANTLSVPLMGTLIIPAAVIAAVLSVFGLGWIGLALMRLGAEWILWVAAWVAGLDNALSHVPAPDFRFVGLIAIGGLIVVLVQGRTRAIGVLVAALGFAGWGTVDRPPILVSPTGGLVGIMTGDGRVLSKSAGDGFVALSWLENDGDPVLRKLAAERSGFVGPNKARYAETNGLVIAHLTGFSAPELAIDACKSADLVVTNKPVTVPGCNLFDPMRLRETGSLAIYPAAVPKILTSYDVSGQRLWNSRDLRRARQRRSGQ